jgi:hypothetical protein
VNLLRSVSWCFAAGLSLVRHADSASIGRLSTVRTILQSLRPPSLIVPRSICRRLSVRTDCFPPGHCSRARICAVNHDALVAQAEAT